MSVPTISAGHLERILNDRDDLRGRLAQVTAERDKLRDVIATFIQLTNNLGVSLTPEHIAESTNALTAHCHVARAALA